MYVIIISNPKIITLTRIEQQREKERERERERERELLFNKVFPIIKKQWKIYSSSTHNLSKAMIHLNIKFGVAHESGLNKYNRIVDHVNSLSVCYHLPYVLSGNRILNV